MLLSGSMHPQHVQHPVFHPQQPLQDNPQAHACTWTRALFDFEWEDLIDFSCVTVRNYRSLGTNGTNMLSEVIVWVY